MLGALNRMLHVLKWMLVVLNRMFCRLKLDEKRCSRYVQYVLLKGLKRAIWPHHKRLGNTYKSIETVRQRPRNPTKKSRRSAAQIQ